MGAAPAAPDKDLIKTFAKLLATDPRPPANFFQTLEKGIPHFGGEAKKDRERAALFLLDAGLVKETAPYLPDLAEARKNNDYSALNLIARHRVMLSNTDKTAAGKDALPLAWELSTMFLTDTKAPAEARAEALSRALILIPELDDDTGSQWLEKTFKNSEGDGLELLASLGTLTAQSRENRSETIRLEQLKLQAAAVNAILSSEKVDPAAWAEIFTLFACQWNHEAEVTRRRDQSTSRRTQAQYDPFGNRFFGRPETQYRGNDARPIGAGEILECKPDGRWLDDHRSLYPQRNPARLRTSAPESEGREQGPAARENPSNR